MVAFEGYESYDALGLAELARRDGVSPVSLLESAIERIEAHNPALNAVVHKLYESAQQSLAAGLPDGRFTGVPFLLKDLFANCAGSPGSNGSRLYDGHVANHDSEIVARYRRAGLVIMGKTNTSEFGLSVTTEPAATGTTRNPWDPNRSPGGSSGGAAAAVAAGIVPAAHGSDGGGSIRIPASACGLFGLKTTRGRNTMAPDAGEGWAGLAGHHVITRSVRDSAALLDATSGPAPGDPYWAPPPARPFLDEVGADPGQLRIAWSVTAPLGVPVDPECQAATEQAARLASDLGHRVEQRDLDLDYEAMREALLTIVAVNTAEALDNGHPLDKRPVRPDEVERITWLFAEAGKAHSPLDYVRAVRTVHRIGRQSAACFEDIDVFLTPTLAQPPAPLGTIDTQHSDLETFGAAVAAFTPFTATFNVTGQPAASVPLHWSDAGLPIGIQIVGRYGEEATLLRLASQFEQASPWFDRRPALAG